MEEYFVIKQDEQFSNGVFIVEHTIHHADTYLKKQVDFKFHIGKRNKPYTHDDVIKVIQNHNISRFNLAEIDKEVKDCFKNVDKDHQIAVGTYSSKGVRGYILMIVRLYLPVMNADDYYDVFDMIFNHFNCKCTYSIVMFLEGEYGKPNIDAFYKVTNFEDSLNQAIRDARSCTFKDD